MKRAWKQLLSISLMLSLLLSLLAGCGTVGSRLPAGSREETVNTEDSTEAAEMTSEEPTTEELTTEGAMTEEPATTEEATTEDATTEEPTTEETMTAAPPTVIEIELDTELEYFRINWKEIRKEGDGYVIIGDKIYGGIVALTYDQKAMLDEGAVLKLNYAGEEIEQLVAGPDANGKLLYWPQNCLMPDIIDSAYLSPERNESEYNAVMKVLENPPYHGKGFYLGETQTGLRYDLIVERNVSWTVSAGVMVEPMCYLAYQYDYRWKPRPEGDWDMARFYEEAIVRDGWYVTTFEVYTEDGEIVRIYEPFSV